MTHHSVIDAIREVEQRLGKDGRVLVRPSGTEPLLRVMVEGASHVDVRRYVEKIANVASTSVNNGVRT